MEFIVRALEAPQPTGDCIVGTCLNQPEADAWRESDPERYADWVLKLKPSAPKRAVVSSAWRRGGDRTTILFATGVVFERVSVLMRRGITALTLFEDADHALQAWRSLNAAAEESDKWRVGIDIYQAAPEYKPEELRKLATAALCVVHARALAGLHSAEVRAGLWRSVQDLASTVLDPAPPREHTPTSADLCCCRVRLLAEVEALLCSAQVHFKNGRIEGACACASHATTRSRTALLQGAIPESRAEEIHQESGRYQKVADTVSDDAVTRGRAFDTSMLCPKISLPTFTF